MKVEEVLILLLKSRKNPMMLPKDPIIIIIPKVITSNHMTLLVKDPIGSLVKFIYGYGSAPIKTLSTFMYPTRHDNSPQSEVSSNCYVMDGMK